MRGMPVCEAASERALDTRCSMAVVKRSLRCFSRLGANDGGNEPEIQRSLDSAQFLSSRPEVLIDDAPRPRYRVAFLHTECDLIGFYMSASCAQRDLYLNSTTIRFEENGNDAVDGLPIDTIDAQCRPGLANVRNPDRVGRSVERDRRLEARPRGR